MGEARNRRVIVPRRGSADVLELVEEPLPEPGTGEVRIKVQAAGVSAFDILVRSFDFPGNPKPPFTPGEDVVGVVDELGEGVTGPAIGDRVAVWTFGRGGGYADYVCAPADEAVPVPADLDAPRAVAAVVNYLTADLYLHRTAHAQAGERVLVHGGAGGLGSALVQLAAVAGCDVYATASFQNHELVAGMAATPIDYRRDDFVDRIRELTDDGVDIVFDPVGGARQLVRSYRTLRRGGRLVPIGSVATQSAGVKSIPLSLLVIGLLKLLPDRRRVPLSPNMMSFPQKNQDWYRTTLRTLLEQAAAGTIEPIVAQCVPLADAAAAHRLLEGRGLAGKVVLVPEV